MISLCKHEMKNKEFKTICVLNYLNVLNYLSDLSLAIEHGELSSNQWAFLFSIVYSSLGFLTGFFLSQPTQRCQRLNLGPPAHQSMCFIPELSRERSITTRLWMISSSQFPLNHSSLTTSILFLQLGPDVPIFNSCCPEPWNILLTVDAAFC